MAKGQVKWFDPKKGYGFIVGPDNQDVFVHYSHIVADGFKSLKDGEWVEYELVQGEKGWQARSVKSEDNGSSPPSDDASQGSADVPVSGGYEGAPRADED